jgi:hypothetical protein
VAVAVTNRGYFSILRWRTDATRDEARNVAVLLVDEAGQFGGMKAAPVGGISPRLKEQGLLDAILFGLEKRFAEDDKPTVDTLLQLRGSLQQSLYLTEPKPIPVPDLDAVLDALYRAYAAPQGGGPKGLTKGVVLDQVIHTLRKGGLAVRRGDYVGDFLFDAIVDSPDAEVPPFIEVLSFASPKREWAAAEYDAGHFLFALERIQGKGLAVIQPPTEISKPGATTSYDRVMRWFKLAEIPTPQPDGLAQLTRQNETQQLALLGRS